MLDLCLTSSYGESHVLEAGLRGIIDGILLVCRHGLSNLWIEVYSSLFIYLSKLFWGTLDIFFSFIVTLNFTFITRKTLLLTCYKGLWLTLSSGLWFSCFVPTIFRLCTHWHVDFSILWVFQFYYFFLHICTKINAYLLMYCHLSCFRLEKRFMSPSFMLYYIMEGES